MPLPLPPTQTYQHWSDRQKWDREKEYCVQFTLCLRKAFATGLEGFSPCLRTVYAFERACLRKVVAFAFQGPFCPCLEGLLPFPSKGLQLCHRMPLPSKGLCLPRHFALVIEKICPLSSKGLSFGGTLRSTRLCLRRSFAFFFEESLPSKGLRRALAFAFEGLFLDAKAPHIMLQIASWDTFAIKGPLPLPSKGFCPQRALLAFYFNHCKILRHRLLLMQHPRTQTHQARLE